MKDVNLLKNEGIDVDHAIELLGDIEMVEETFSDFLEESKERLPRLEEAFNSSDMETYAIDAHAMKSDSKYLGFTKLAEMSYEHELAGKENNIEFVKENYNSLISEAKRIINLINTYLGT